jgi:FeS assembly protein IscX
LPDALTWRVKGQNTLTQFKEQTMPREIMWTDSEEIGIQLQEKFPDIDPLTVRFTDLLKYVTELEGFADDPAKSNESRLEAIQMAWHEEFEDAKG